MKSNNFTTFGSYDGEEVFVSTKADKVFRDNPDGVLWYTAIGPKKQQILQAPLKAWRGVDTAMARRNPRFNLWKNLTATTIQNVVSNSKLSILEVYTIFEFEISGSV